MMTIKLGKIYNAPIILTPNYFIYIGVILALTLFRSGMQTAFTTLLAITGISICVLLHEIGHTIAGNRYGVRTESIGLYFFGGIASPNSYDWHRLLDRPKKAIVVWICGPFVNLIIIGLLIFIIFALTKLPSSTPYLSIIISDLSWMRYFNIGMAIFNLLPLYPLDGGGILYSVCRIYTSKLKAIRIASVVSIIGCLVLIIFAIKYKALVAGIIVLMILFEAIRAPRSELFK